MQMMYRAFTTHSCGLAEAANYVCDHAHCLIEANAMKANYSGFDECSLLCEGCEPDPVKSSVSSSHRVSRLAEEFYF